MTPQTIIRSLLSRSIECDEMPQGVRHTRIKKGMMTQWLSRTLRRRLREGWRRLFWRQSISGSCLIKPSHPGMILHNYSKVFHIAKKKKKKKKDSHIMATSYMYVVHTRGRSHAIKIWLPPCLWPIRLSQGLLDSCVKAIVEVPTRLSLPVALLVLAQYLGGRRGLNLREGD